MPVVEVQSRFLRPALYDDLLDNKNDFERIADPS